MSESVLKLKFSLSCSVDDRVHAFPITKLSSLMSFLLSKNCPLNAFFGVLTANFLIVQNLNFNL